MKGDDRFSFGENWSNFLSSLTGEQIVKAQSALQSITGLERLQALSFLDIGSGSGLSSLAARNLGAKVRSFDFDVQSVACTQELRRKYYSHDDTDWKIERGSALDREYLSTLGTFDIVYSWGVLHHTGAMWRAFELIPPLVKPSGRLCLAIYNDQGAQSKLWWYIKRFYNRSSKPVQFATVCAIAALFETLTSLYYVATLQNPFRRWARLKSERGMSLWHDWIDWVGGFPFEVASPEEIFTFFSERGFTLAGLKTKRGEWGCCEYLFIRKTLSPPPA